MTLNLVVYAVSTHPMPVGQAARRYIYIERLLLGKATQSLSFIGLYLHPINVGLDLELSGTLKLRKECILLC